MRIRTLAIGVGVLAIATAGLHLLERREQAAPPADPRVGAPLADAAAIRDLSAIRIYEGGAERVALVRDAAGAWVLPGKDGLPVDFRTLGSLVNRLTEVKVERFVTRQPDRLERLDPNRTGIAFFATADAAEPALALRFGKASDRGGVYVQFGDDPAAYLAGESIYLNTVPDSWIDKALFGISFDDVRSLRVTFPGQAPLPEVTFARADAAAPFSLPEDLAAGWQLQETAAQDWARALATARFTRTEPQDAPPVVEALAHARVYEIAAASGWRWKVTLARRPEQQKEAPPPDPEAAEPAKPETIPAGPAYAIIEAVPPEGQAAPAYYARLAFEIPAYTFTRQPGFDDLLQPSPPAPDAAPSE